MCLQRPLQITLPTGADVSLGERKKHLAGLLIEFIHRYSDETRELSSSPLNNPTTSGHVAPDEFEMFLKFGSEQDVEEILTIYTQGVYFEGGHFQVNIWRS